MVKDNKQYVLAYGFRRLSACRKLGWKTISCYLVREDKVISIPINEIKIIGNTRINVEEDLSDLMSSIKQNGLLEPIGVYVAGTLLEKDFLVLNITENLQRANISTIELSNAIHTLKELGLNVREIATRLGLKEPKVNNIIQFGRVFNKSQLASLSLKGSKDNGKVSITAAGAITNARLTVPQTKEFFELSKKHNLKVKEINLIAQLIKSGMSLSEAHKTFKNYEIYHIKILTKKGKYKEYYQDARKDQIVSAILRGELPTNSEVFHYFKKR